MKEAVHAERDSAQVLQERARPSAGAADPLRDSPRLVAQRARIDAAFGAVAQKAGGLEDEEPLQPRMETAAPQNETGMPNQLKAGIESLSGMDMSDVRVHRNSDRPAQLNALAYAQGNDIHLGPGQEQHLPHEAWHVVQQAQGRVRPTTQMAGVAVNDDAGLEGEADAMGERAVAQAKVAGARQASHRSTSASASDLTTVQRLPGMLDSAMSLWQRPGWESAKDLIDVRRWRLNPLNLLAGVINEQEETQVGSNYHSSARHGAHNTVANAMGRLAVAGGGGSAMTNYYGGAVPTANTTSRFNSEAWESYSWRKAKESFAAGAGAAGVAVNWLPNAPVAGAPRSSWNVVLDHGNSDVGITATAAAAPQSVSRVKVAINYVPDPLAGAPTIDAWNGQMFPVSGAAVSLGHVQAGHPAIANNGTVMAIPYERWTW